MICMQEVEAELTALGYTWSDYINAVELLHSRCFFTEGRHLAGESACTPTHTHTHLWEAPRHERTRRELHIHARMSVVRACTHMSLGVHALYMHSFDYRACDVTLCAPCVCVCVQCPVWTCAITRSPPLRVWRCDIAPVQYRAWLH